MKTRADALADMRQELASSIEQQIDSEGVVLGAIPGLQLYRQNAIHSTSALNVCQCQVYEPALAVIAQGAKALQVGSRRLLYGEGAWLLTSLHVPVISKVTKASPNNPYLACSVTLDLDEGRKMLAEFESTPTFEPANGLAVTTGAISSELLDAVLRLVRLNRNPNDIPIIARLLQREIFYRLLATPSAQVLRQIVTAGSQSHRVAKAVNWLRANFREPLQVEKLAQFAQMGVSTLHHHFRELTGSSPLQFQKRLRLFEARRLMLAEGRDAASAAFETGYESPTQFSREYRRQFGQPPRRDVTGFFGTEPPPVLMPQEF